MLTKYQIKIAAAILAILLIGLAVYGYRINFQPLGKDYVMMQTQNSPSENVQLENPNKSSATVHIAGAVRYPGLYTINKGTRALEAIEQAGGLLSEADLDKVNLAQPLKDGKRLYIPFIKREKVKAKPEQKIEYLESAAINSVQTHSNEKHKSKAPNFPVSINDATPEDLGFVPGVGPSLAEAIVRHREKIGPYQQLEDLLRIKGFGRKKLNRISPYLAL